MTAVETSAVLLSRLISMVEVSTLTRLTSVVPMAALVGCTTMFTLRCAFGPMVPRLQTIWVMLVSVVTVPAAGAVQVPPPTGVAEMKRTFGGRISVILTFSARLSPIFRLIAETVYCRFCPAAMVATAVLATVRSARRSIV